MDEKISHPKCPVCGKLNGLQVVNPGQAIAMKLDPFNADLDEGVDMRCPHCEHRFKSLSAVSYRRMLEDFNQKFRAAFEHERRRASKLEC